MIELTSGQILDKIRKDISDAESKGFKILIKMTSDFQSCRDHDQIMIPAKLMGEACEVAEQYQNAVQTLNTVTDLMKSISDSQTTHIR